MIIREFPSSYDVSLVEDLARPELASLPRLFFPGATLGGRDGVSVLLNASSPQAWIATYAFESPNGLVRIATCPDPSMLVAVSGGSGYLTYPHDRERWSSLPVYMVEQLVPIQSRGLILLAHATGILALDSSGIAWCNHELSSGSTSIESIDGEIATGTAEDPSQETHRAAFTINVLTGEHMGGKAKLVPLTPPPVLLDWRTGKPLN